MTRRNAVLFFFTAIASRLEVKAQPLMVTEGKHTGLLLLDIPKANEHMTYFFEAKTLSINIDGRQVTLTAKEIADALGAK